ncbi:InlB B-repeat-containing protein [Pontibacter ruber]|uniref:T9SS type A sorting domain-containing protein n=1 Tax=Pontibacter ruber TaxID=1343895 RepID=A0ABW5D0X6_9BACT|nr:T9SS type A sorting domain-containing protein [Pontibacter ruber]
MWSYAGKHWAVIPNSSGTHLWRLDGTTWTNVLRLSTKTTSKADCKMVGNVAHILLFQGASSQMVSVEYISATGTYQLWSKRTSTVGLTFEKGVETATIDIDGTGRMWLASDGSTTIHVRWSDAPYNTWSSPITVASGVTTDDIGAVIAMPGKIGVLWSNQTTKKFGFKTHADGASPTSWSADEVPASQSALSIGGGMADDHLNMAVAGDGTLYCAVKTSYETKGYPEIMLLVRSSSGGWHKAYEVSPIGTRPIVLLNESIDKIRVIYTKADSGGDILYRESSFSTIAFSSPLVLMTGGTYNNSTSTKDNFTDDIVVLASSSSEAVGVLAQDNTTLPPSDQIAPTVLSINRQSPSTATTSATAVTYRITFSESVSGVNAIDFTPVAVSGTVTGTLTSDAIVAVGTSGTTYDATVSSITDTGTLRLDLKSSNTGIADAAGNAITTGFTSGQTYTIEQTQTSTEYILTVNTTGNGTVTKNPDQATYTSGSTVSLTVTPATGYQFSGWSGDASGTTNPLSVTMNDNKAITATFTPVSSSQQVVSFTLINASADQDIKTIVSGEQINLATLPSTKLSIRANTSPATVGSVRLVLTGPQTRNYTDNAPPYSLFGDDGNGNYYFGVWGPPALGNYTLTATPYSATSGGGSAGTPMTINFTIVNEAGMTANSTSQASTLDNSKTLQAQVYPNPFSGRATLNFTLAKESEYIVGLYDSKGQQVRILKNGMSQAGQLTSIEVDGAGLANGLYFIRLHTNEGTKFVKLLLDR